MGYSKNFTTLEDRSFIWPTERNQRCKKTQNRETSRKGSQKIKDLYTIFSYRQSVVSPVAQVPMAELLKLLELFVVRMVKMILAKMSFSRMKPYWSRSKIKNKNSKILSLLDISTCTKYAYSLLESITMLQISLWMECDLYMPLDSKVSLPVMKLQTMI